MNYGLELVILAALLILHGWLLRQVLPASRVWLAAGALSLMLGAASMIVSPAAWSRAAEGNGQYLRALALLWALFAPLALALWLWAAKKIPTHQPARRAALRSLAALPPAAAAFGILTGRTDFRVVAKDLHFSQLNPSLDHLHIVQLSDIHFGPFLTAAELRRVVGLANDLKPDIVALTGDFITRTPEHLDECLNVLRELRARGPILGCLGNHEGYARCEDYTAKRAASLGWRILRHQRLEVQPGLVISGVDYEWKKSGYLRRAGSLRVPDAFNILLAHNPDTFPRAAQLGFDLTLSGHTHGGQVDIELLDEHFNLVRAFTPYTRGLYEIGAKKCFVTAGIGTIGVPLRIGAPPEVASIRLCAS